VTVPSGQRGDRDDLALTRTSVANGFPHAPAGDPMVDGVGPASWAPRRDMPELDGHGNVKIKPMRMTEAMSVSAGTDPRGMPVIGKDDTIAGTVTDLWVDKPEQLVRYLEIELTGGGKRLAPITMVQIKPRYVWVKSISSGSFAKVPTTAKDDQITLLEEDKICGFYAGGLMYDQ